MLASEATTCAPSAVGAGCSSACLGAHPASPNAAAAAVAPALAYRKLRRLTVPFNKAMALSFPPTGPFAPALLEAIVRPVERESYYL